MLAQRDSSFLIAIVSLLLWGCGQGDSRQGESEVLRELAASHSWLVPEGSDPSTYYRPSKRSWSENSGIEMTLLSPPGSFDKGHRVVLLRNAGSEKPVGLVLPSNASTDYWKFEFDGIVGPLRDTLDFSGELLRVARSLGKAGHPKEYRSLVFDLFRSLLLTDMVQASDSTIEWPLTITEGLGEENDSLGVVRRVRILGALADTTYTRGGLLPKPVAFFDDEANRIYLFEPMDLYGGEPPRERVHVFRWGRNVIPMEFQAI